MKKLNLRTEEKDCILYIKENKIFFEDLIKNFSWFHNKIF